MTDQIFFPDISNVGNKGLILEPETVAVTAKASEGTSFTDPSYLGFKAQADAQGSVWDAYHWLWPGNEDAQAAHVLSITGTQVPIMIDAENDVTGAYLTVPGICAFVDAIRRRGGITRKLYLPHWYWTGPMKGASLAPLVSRGMLLVASDYRTYDPNNWPQPYGGFASVFQWQYTSSLKYGNQTKVDFNAVRMTAAAYRTAIGYESVSPTPPPTTHPTMGDDMVSHWPTQKLGSKGWYVARAQELLKARGYNIGKSGVDADFGGFTEGATRALQAHYGISVDGEFGPQTYSVAMYEHDYTR